MALRAKFLYRENRFLKTFEIVEEESDPGIRPHVSTHHTTISDIQLGSHRFNRFSSRKSLIRAITCLIHIVRSFKDTRTHSKDRCKGWHLCKNTYATSDLEFSKNHVILTVQREAYFEEIQYLTTNTPIPENSMLKRLDPFIDDSGLLQVGGQLKESKLEFIEKFPLIFPGRCHVAYLIMQHYHSLVKHQGRLFTEGAIRYACLWIVGVKKLISSTIFKCIVCRRLCGSTQTQKMADLPADRFSTDPPFTSIGLDIFGPWSVIARHTRGGQAKSKCWAVLFTCMSIRAIHIEVIKSLDTSSYINALR
ncbi:RNA-mediated [Pristimantis euphronides]